MLMTGYLAPMLASPLPGSDDLTREEILALLPAYVRSKNWIQEIKFDGHRKTVMVHDHQVSGISRPARGKPGNIWMIPEHLRVQLATLPDGTYDGEWVLDGGTSSDVVIKLNVKKTKFVIFDVPMLLGHSAIHKPLYERRALLAEMFRRAQYAALTHVSIAVATDVDVERIRTMWKNGGEGVILKRKDSLYFPGRRTKDWIKIKNLQSAVMTVVGFLPGKNGPYSRVLLHDKDGRKVKVKVKTDVALERISKNPNSFIGRLLRIEYNERTKNGYRHPRWDHFEDE
jgi:ATP-dependent DNA ligase